LCDYLHQFTDFAYRTINPSCEITSHTLAILQLNFNLKTVDLTYVYVLRRINTSKSCHFTRTLRYLLLSSLDHKTHYATNQFPADMQPVSVYITCCCRPSVISTKIIYASQFTLSSFAADCCPISRCMRRRYECAEKQTVRAACAAWPRSHCTRRPLTIGSPAAPITSD
jgi:hypothetical protein